MENQKVYEIIKLEKEINRSRAVAAVTTTLIAIPTALLCGLTLESTKQHNVAEAICGGAGTMLGIVSMISYCKFRVNKTNKMIDEVKTLKKQAGINENR